jgi:hypothetical protein
MNCVFFLPQAYTDKGGRKIKLFAPADPSEIEKQIHSL